MQEAVRELLGKRKNRAIAIILSTKESECDEFLPDASSAKLRKVVLDQLNEFHDICADIIDSVDTGAIVNTIYLEKIADIHEYITSLDDEEGFDDT